MESPLSYALLSTLDALNGSITPELRAVVVNVKEKEKIFYIRFFYNGIVSEEIIELWSDVIGEANFYPTDEGILRLDYPEKIPCNGSLAYYRKEPKDLVKAEKVKKSFKLPYENEKYFSANLRLAMQSALLGMVPPNLRVVCVDYFENHITVYFYYDGKITTSEENDMNKVMTHFSKYFPYYSIYLRKYVMDYPIIPPVHKDVVYYRHEERIEDRPFYETKNR
jgi:hypothetical protein